MQKQKEMERGKEKQKETKKMIIPLLRRLKSHHFAIPQHLHLLEYESDHRLHYNLMRIHALPLISFLFSLLLTQPLSMRSLQQRICVGYSQEEVTGIFANSIISL